jgi:hypothetical protein
VFWEIILDANEAALQEFLSFQIIYNMQATEFLD